MSFLPSIPSIFSTPCAHFSVDFCPHALASARHTWNLFQHNTTRSAQPLCVDCTYCSTPYSSSALMHTYKTRLTVLYNYRPTRRQSQRPLLLTTTKTFQQIDPLRFFFLSSINHRVYTLITASSAHSTIVTTTSFLQ